MKVVLVTGGSFGIGRQLCIKLVAKGYKVGILDIAEKEGLDLSENLNKKYGLGSCIFCKCDVSNETSFKESFDVAIKEWGRVDVLINNAGFWNDCAEAWRKSIDVNLNGTITGSLLAIQYMGKNHGHQGGVVVNISSVLGFTVHPLMPIYSASKAAVFQFTRDMGTDHQYQLHGVKFITICPHGTVESNFFDGLEKKFIFSEKKFIQLFYDVKMETFQTAENVANGIISSLEKGENGSVWVIEDEEGARKIDVPEIKVKEI